MKYAFIIFTQYKKKKKKEPEIMIRWKAHSCSSDCGSYLCGLGTSKYPPATMLCATTRLADMFIFLLTNLVRTVHSKSPCSKQGALCVHLRWVERTICNSLASSAPFHALREKSLYLGKMKGLKIKIDYYFKVIICLFRGSTFLNGKSRRLHQDSLNIFLLMLLIMG